LTGAVDLACAIIGPEDTVGGEGWMCRAGGAGGFSAPGIRTAGLPGDRPGSRKRPGCSGCQRKC